MVNLINLGSTGSLQWMGMGMGMEIEVSAQQETKIEPLWHSKTLSDHNLKSIRSKFQQIHKPVETP